MLSDLMPRFISCTVACVALLAGAGAVEAQGSGEVAAEVGATDGRRLGLTQGRTLGRAQALYQAFHEGFGQGLEEARASGGRDAVVEAFRARGRTAGETAGAAAGREAGAAEALEGWLAGSGRPGRVTKRDRPAPPPAQAPAACRPAAPLLLPLDSDIKVEINPDGLEKRESPVVVDSFDLAFPLEDDLRNRARAAGAVSHAVDFWVRDYKDAFQSAWNQTFENERSGTSLDAKNDLRSLGLDIGRKEGERRRGCEIGEREWVQGFEAAWSEAYGTAFDEAWDETDARHAKRAVVVLRDARLVDASGDGLLEPGEAARIEGRLINAGALGTQRSSGSWGALRGFESEGHFEGDLGPGESRDLAIDLGPSDASAPPGTSVVVRLRGMGSEPITLSERLGRPARIEGAEAQLALDGGRLVARIEATIASTSPASARAELELAGEGAVSPVGRLAGGQSRTLTLTMPADLPNTIGALATGVFVLRTRDGQPWHAGRWSAPFGPAEAAALAGQRDAPAALSALLIEHLSTEWDATTALESPTELPEGFAAYAAARESLPQDDRRRLDQAVTAPLLRHVEDRSGPKRLRKRARELLAG